MLIYIVIFMVFTFLFFEEVFIMMNNKRRHSRRRWLHLSAKKTLITIVLAVIMVAAISIYGIIIVNASNSNPEKSQTQRFYTSITVQPDDTLWNIADSYASDGESHQQYINAVKSLNNMTDDTIYSGQNIVIYYTI